MAAHLAPPSLGFSRQEHWSGLPFPSPMCENEVAQSCLTLHDPMGCSPLAPLSRQEYWSGVSRPSPNRPEWLAIIQAKLVLRGTYIQVYIRLRDNAWDSSWNMDKYDSQPVYCSLSVPVCSPKAFKVSRPFQSPVLEECSGTSMPTSARCHHHPWRHPCQLRIRFVCKSRDLYIVAHTHRGWLGSTASMRVATAVPSSAVQRFQNPGLCDSPGIFLILSGVQISSLYSRHEGENGKARNHSIYSRKTIVFPEISYFSLSIMGQYSSHGPHRCKRGLEMCSWPFTLQKDAFNLTVGSILCPVKKSYFSSS